MEGRANRYVTPDQVIDLFVDPPISFLLTRLVNQRKRTGLQAGEILDTVRRGLIQLFIFFICDSIICVNFPSPVYSERNSSSYRVNGQPFFFGDCAVLLWSSDDPEMVVEMTKFYMRWHLNPMLIPTNPEERMKLWMSMLELVKADIKSGTMV